MSHTRQATESQQIVRGILKFLVIPFAIIFLVSFFFFPRFAFYITMDITVEIGLLIVTIELFDVKFLLLSYIANILSLSINIKLYSKLFSITINRNRNGFIIMLLISFNIFLVNSYFIFFCKKPKDFTIIVHAGGGSEGKKKLNAIEPFMDYYKKGFRLIELDFVFTKDREDVFCTHEFEYLGEYFFDNRPTILTVKESLSMVNGKYHPMYLDFLLKFMKNHEDLTIVFDTKEDDDVYYDMMKFVIKKAESVGIKWKKRFIPCVFSYNNYKQIHEFGFEELWFSNYREKYSWPKMSEYFRDKQDLTTYVLSKACFLKFKLICFNPEIQGKKVDVYTTNGKSNVEFFALRGANYIVSDFPYVRNESAKIGKIE